MKHYSLKSVLCILTMLPLLVFSQVKIKGTVTDSEKEFLPGVSVLIKGTTTGTITDINGNYSIEIPSKNSILVFSYIGFITKEVNCKDQTILNISLTAANLQLNDVVVVGYGTQQKKDLTGAIQSVKNTDLVKAMNSNVTESLNGRVAGVLVTKSSNRPGADMSVEIRGINSINSSNEPLYVIDGIPSYSGLKFLNSADIESIDILKDASSCAIYGSRGANGVVIVTTKGANKSKGFTIEYNGSEAIKMPTRIPDMIGSQGNGLEYVDYRIKLWQQKYGDASLTRPDFLTAAERKRIRYGQYYDWLRELSNNGYVSSHSINSSGSNDNTSYTVGLGYLKDQGLISNESFTRITGNVGIEHKISKKMRTGFTVYLSKNNNDLGSRNALLNAYFIPPTVSPWDEDGELLFNCQPTSSKINPLMQIKNNIHQSESYFVNTSSFLEVVPVNDLTLKSQIAYQFDNSVTGEYIGVFTQENSGINPAYATRDESRNANWVWDNTINYKKKFAEIHKLELTGLFSMQKDTHAGSGMMGADLPYESYWHAIQTASEISNVSSYYWASSMISYMFRVNYSLLDKYMVTATGRYDGTSRLSIGNQWGFMPSLAFAWRMNQEDFLKDIKQLNNLKIRISYGKTGNNNLSHDISITKLALSKYPFNGTGNNGFGLNSSKGNADLQWEMTSEYNLGVDFGLFNSRITGTLDMYSRITDGLIFNRSIGTVNGYNSIFQNIGTTSNKGIEVSINTVNIKTKNLQWRTGFTFSLNRNKIIDLYGDKKDDLGNRWFIGQPVNVVYDLKQLGVWQEDQADLAKVYGQSVGHIRVEDKNEDKKIDANDYQILGVRSPSWTAGLTSGLSYKNFDMDFDMYARIGGLYNDEFLYMFTAWDNEHWNKLNVDYWTPENKLNKYQQIGAVSYYTQVLGQVNGTFLKVRNISLAYNMNENKVLKSVGIKSLRLYSNIQNPFTFTNYPGSDPEIIGENVYTQLSLFPMTITMGLKVVF
jgi:TonB-linked SusC/RagA family outer membrane protein